MVPNLLNDKTRRSGFYRTSNIFCHDGNKDKPVKHSIWI